MLLEAAGLAFLAALSPTALLVTAVYLGSDRPKLIGALYLLYLPAKHFIDHPENRPGGAKATIKTFLGLSAFWSTVIRVELTDIVFALDSVPAVLAITRNPMIVYSSNVLAMFGLRSLYFVVSDALQRLRFLRQGLAVVLVFTGAKMIGSGWVDISPGLSVSVIGLVLSVTIIASVRPRRSPSV
jgi:tellurite resistance protein TerC